MDEQQQLLAAKLNLETGQLSWPELERHFARGVVMLVAQSADLIDVATAFSNDDKATVESWLQSAQVRAAEMADAAIWHQQQTHFWSVVVAPFVLVQAIDDHL